MKQNIKLEWPKGQVSTTATNSEFGSTRDLETVNRGVNREVFEIFPHFQVFQQLIFNTQTHDRNFGLSGPRQMHAV